MILNIINEEFSVCKVADYEGIDLSSPYIFIGSTDEEKSLVCPIKLVPDNTVERDDGWKAFRIEGILDFSLIGILAAISKVLVDGYREKAYEGDTKAMNRMLAPMAYAASPINGDAQRYELAANGGDAQAQFATGWFLMTGTGVPVDEKKGLK